MVQLEIRTSSLRVTHCEHYLLSVALSVMAFEFALISRVGFTASAFGQDALLTFHRQMGLMASVLVLLHVVFVFRNGYPTAWLRPYSDGIVMWGALALLASCQYFHSALPNRYRALGKLGTHVSPTLCVFQPT